MFGFTIKRTKNVEDMEEMIKVREDLNIELKTENFNLMMDNSMMKREIEELTVTLEKTRCRFVPVNDKNMNVLEDENFYLNQRVEALKRTLIQQDEYYKNFVVQVTLIDV